MFHRRSSEFEPRISAITDHLRGIRRELGAIGDSAGQSASGTAAAAVDQIVDTLRPVAQDTEPRFRAGQHRPAAEGATLANEALRRVPEAGSRALDRISEQAEAHP